VNVAKGLNCNNFASFHHWQTRNDKPRETYLGSPQAIENAVYTVDTTASIFLLQTGLRALLQK